MNYLQLTTCHTTSTSTNLPPPSSSLDEHEGLETSLLPPSAPVSPPPGPKTHLGPWFSPFFLPFSSPQGPRHVSALFLFISFHFFFIITKPETLLGLFFFLFLFLFLFQHHQGPRRVSGPGFILFYFFTHKARGTRRATTASSSTRKGPKRRVDVSWAISFFSFFFKGYL